MNMQNLMNPDAYGDMIAALRRILQAAASRRGVCPRDRKPRQQLLHEHATRLMTAKKTEALVAHDAATAFRSTMVPPPYPPCILPLSALQKISFRELRLETHHRGRFLLVRSLPAPWKAAGIGTIIEDEEGEALQLQLYHQLRPHAQQETEEALVPAKSVFVIKEPYFKVTGDGGYGVRVDHVSDVVWLAVDDERIPDAWRASVSDHDKEAEQWKEEGNIAFKAGNSREAVVRYTLALKGSPNESLAQTIRLNRSLAYLNMESFDAALEDASTACAGTKPPEKALYRAATALYHLGRYDECFVRREQLLREYPDADADRGEIQYVGQRLHERATGEYDFRRMYDVIRAGGRHVDMATFAGPVAVKTSTGRGRGLFTTRAVKAGELLLCEKAFAYCSADDPDSSHGTSTAQSASSSSPPQPPAGIGVLISLHYDLVTIGKQPDVITTAIQKIFRNPSLGPTFTSLHSGSYKSVDAPQLVDGHPVVDSFLAERIVSLNSFGCPSTSYADAFRARNMDEDGQTTNAGSIKCGIEEELKDRYYTSGIWLLASHINHSCCGTAERSFIGDALILRAARDLAADEELTFAYMFAKEDDDKRATLDKRLRGQWDFECRCALCAEARATPVTVSKKRRSLLTEVRTTIGAVVVSIDKTSADIRSGRDIGSMAPRTHVWINLLTKAERLGESIAKTYLDPPPKAVSATAGGSQTGKYRASRDDETSQEPAELLAPRPHLAMALALLSMAWYKFAAVTPPGLRAPVHAAHAASTALKSLAALGFVIRGGDISPGAGGRLQHAGSAQGQQSAGPSDNPQDVTLGESDTIAVTAAAATLSHGAESHAAAQHVPPRLSEEPALVVEKWGLVRGDAFRIWDQLARAYELAGAPASLVIAAVRNLRTAYRILIGEDEATFATVYPEWAHVV